MFFLPNNIFGIMAVSVNYYGFWQCLINLVRLYQINVVLELIFLRDISVSERLVNIILITIIENIFFIFSWIIGEILDNNYIAIILIIIYKAIIVLIKYKDKLNNKCKISIIVIYIILVGITSSIFLNSLQRTEEETYREKGIFLEVYREQYNGRTKTDWEINIRN
jgi:hypothetical protein